MLVQPQICVIHENYGTQMTQIERISTDFLVRLIRANPYRPFDPCSIFGCGFVALGTTFRQSFDLLRLTYRP